MAAEAASDQQRPPRTRVVGIIPARYQSQRFPGKPLALIAGKPMIVRTYEQAKQATSLDALVVATDDERIADVCRAAGAEVVMTSEACPNGTERCSEAVGKLGAEYDIVVNIQGDEPLLEPEIIDQVVAALQAAPDAVYRFTEHLFTRDVSEWEMVSTACTPLRHEDVALRQRVKCVTDVYGYALYFSRGMLPHNKDGAVKPFPPPFQNHSFKLHLGLQCYDRAFLSQYCRMPATPLMLMEDLEQLKVLENGYRIKVVTVDHCAHGVDEPQDIASIEAKLRELGQL